ncbi:MAG: quinolinate synthase NadA [Deltaproteobacteria bacterium]|jgi:quinolinate synthase|nr:quinolinate synthase NadA [Deltaproteobacteria bacterium]
MFSEKKLAQMTKVKELASSLGVEILAHYYQRPEIKKVATYVGGSRGIFRWAQKTRAKTVLLCGVSFMAETIERLKPELSVLIPREDASCPFSETVNANSIWEIRAKDAKAYIVAEAKAPWMVKDLADAIAPVDIDPEYWNNINLNKLNLNKRLYLLPGPNAPWPSGSLVGPNAGVCQVHWQVEVETLAKIKWERPEALVAVNVLCQDEVKARADKVGDSQALFEFCADSPAKEFIVVSEMGLAESLAQAYPNKRFYDPGVEIFCPNMKLTGLRDLISSLESYQLKEGLLTRFGARALEGRLNHDLPG